MDINDAHHYFFLIVFDPGGYSNLSWVRMYPITKPEQAQICNLCLNHLFLERSLFKPISTFYHVNWDA